MRFMAAVLSLTLGASIPGAGYAAAATLTPPERPAVEAISHAAAPCHDLDWHAERGGIDRDDVELLLARLDCRPAQFARTAVELAHGRAGCDDIDWAARTESITAAQWGRLLDRYPDCRPAPSLIDQAEQAASRGDYRTVVRLAARAYGIPEARFMAVAACESGFNPDAYNRSGASGLLQHIAGLFAPRAASAGFPGASPFDPVANAWAGAYLWSVSGSGPWSQCL